MLVDEDKVRSLHEVLDIVPGMRIAEGDSYAYCMRHILMFGKTSIYIYTLFEIMYYI